MESVAWRAPAGNSAGWAARQRERRAAPTLRTARAARSGGPRDPAAWPPWPSRRSGWVAGPPARRCRLSDLALRPVRVAVGGGDLPRLLTGPVRKNSPSERERYLGAVPMRPELGRLAAASEGAFDAAISAVVMAARVDELRALPDAPGYALEGKIWQPRYPVALGTGGRLAQGAYGELATAVAAVIREAAARGESATTQAEQVLDMLSRRGLLGRNTDQPLS
jgi:hypothetical protein